MVIGAVYPERGLGRLSVSVEPINLNSDPLAPCYPSPGVRANSMLFVIGHAAISEPGELAGLGNFYAQTQVNFESLKRVRQRRYFDLTATPTGLISSQLRLQDHSA